MMASSKTKKKSNGSNANFLICGSYNSDEDDDNNDEEEIEAVRVANELSNSVFIVTGGLMMSKSYSNQDNPTATSPSPGLSTHLDMATLRNLPGQSLTELPVIVAKNMGVKKAREKIDEENKEISKAASVPITNSNNNNTPESLENWRGKQDHNRESASCQQADPSCPMPVFSPRSSCLPVAKAASAANNRIDSPDNDSAFSDNSSMLSCEGGSNGVKQATSAEARIKSGAVKGDLAPADQRVYVKIFCADGSTKSVLIDRTMRAGDILDILVEKNHVQLQPSWGLVEHLPDLYMERCFEDHEIVLDALLRWKPDSKNKLFFVARPERYDLFRRPEKYLLGSSAANSQQLSGQQQQQQPWDQESRQALLQEVFFSRDENSTEMPSFEIEGPLWLKVEGKKAWKKYYFFLLQSGLFCCTRSGKKPASEKDLVCITNSYDTFKVYSGFSWKKKFKSPNDFVFALKPPGVHDPKSPAIRHLCADNELTLNQWITALRIVQLKNQLLENYNDILMKMQVGLGKENLYGTLRQKENALPNGETQNADLMMMSDLREALPDPVQSAPLATMDDSSSSVSGINGGSMVMSSHENSLTSTSSLTSSSNNSVSSGCVSETSSISDQDQENEHEIVGFDSEFPEGGTIRRKSSNQRLIYANLPQNTTTDVPDEGNGAGDHTPTPTTECAELVTNRIVSVSQTLYTESETTTVMPNHTISGTDLPPPPMSSVASSTSEFMSNQLSKTSSAIGGSDVSLNSLPPPPEELKFPMRYAALAQQQQTNQQLYGTAMNIQSQSIYHGGNNLPLTHAVQSPTSHFQHLIQPNGSNPDLLHPCSMNMREQQVSCNSSWNGKPTHPLMAPNAEVSPMGNGGYLIQEEIYPCGVFRAVYPKNCHVDPNCQRPNELLSDINTNGLPYIQPQLQRQQLTLPVQNILTSPDKSCDYQPLQQPRRRKIKFNEVVKHINLGSSEPLKGTAHSPEMENFPTSSERNPNPGRLFDDQGCKETPPRAFLNDLQKVMQRKFSVAQKFHFGSGSSNTCNGNSAEVKKEQKFLADKFADHVKEKDVSNWILQSLKHSHITEVDMSQDLYDTSSGQTAIPILRPEQRPKIYNGRTVPNCYPPGNEKPPIQPQVQSMNQSMPCYQNLPFVPSTANQQIRHCQSMTSSVNQVQRRVPPPTPPKRNDATQLTSPR